MKHIKYKKLQQEKLTNFSQLSPAERRLLLKTNPELVIKSLSLATRQVYDYMIRMHSYHKNIYPSHAHIGQVVRKSRRQVIRVLQVLRDWGLIHWDTPSMSWLHRRANHYVLDPIIHDLTFRKRVGYYIWGLRTLPLVLLVSAMALANARSEEHVTPIKQLVLNPVQYSTVQYLCTDNSSNQKRVIRYTKVRAGLTKKERRMLVEEAILSTEAIKSVKFSKWAKFQLGAFRPEAIAEADKRMMLMTGKIQNSFGLFKSYCLDWHKKRNIKPDFSHVDEFKGNCTDTDLLPLYEGDGSVERPSTGLPARDLAKEFGLDTESQPHYQAQQKSAAPQREFHQEEGSRKQPYSKPLPFVPNDPYAAGGKYAYLKEKRNPDTFDRESSFNQACDHFKQELSAGKTINPFAQIMLDLQAGKRLDQAPPYEQMAKILSSFVADRSAEPEKKSPPAPRIVDRDVISSEDAPFVEPGDYEDWVWQEI